MRSREHKKSEKDPGVHKGSPAKASICSGDAEDARTTNGEVQSSERVQTARRDCHHNHHH